MDDDGEISVERSGFQTTSGAVNVAERMPVEMGKSIGHSTADDPDQAEKTNKKNNEIGMDGARRQVD